MATKRITDLPAAGAPSEADLYPVVQGNSTNKQTLPALRAALGVNINNFANLSGSADQMAYFSGVGVLSLATLTAFARSLLDDADAAAMRATLGLGSSATRAAGGANGTATLGTDSLVTPAQLAVAIQALGLLTPAANTFPYWTSATVAANATLTASARALLALAGASDGLPYYNGTTTAALATFTTFARSLLDDADAATARTTLGVLAQADKPTWTAYTPVITANTGTFTDVTANGSYLVLYGMCYLRITITFTTLGSGGGPTISLPFTALTGTAGMPMAAQKITGLPARSGTARVTTALNVLALIGADGAELGNADGNVVTIMGSYPIA